MTPKQGKLAYILLCCGFTLWLALILSACFSSGRWTATIVFANQFMLALFIGSAVLSSIPAMFLGLNYLGISFGVRKARQNPKKGLLSITRTHARRKETSPSRKSSEELKGTKRKSTIKEQSSTEQANGTVETASASLNIPKEDDSKNKDSMKAFYLFGETEFDHCGHKLGYLKGLPKNKPIPDECFGCPKILECIALTKNK
jgi:hypothetical protein